MAKPLCPKRPASTTVTPVSYLTMSLILFACSLSSVLAVFTVSAIFGGVFESLFSVEPDTLICSSCSERLPSWLVGWLVGWLVELHKQHLPLAQA